MHSTQGTILSINQSTSISASEPSLSLWDAYRLEKSALRKKGSGSRDQANLMIKVVSCLLSLMLFVYQLIFVHDRSKGTYSILPAATTVKIQVKQKIWQVKGQIAVIKVQ